MPEGDDHILDVEGFLRDQIDTVPHLEALLLLWHSRPKPWSVNDMAKGLFVSAGTAKDILDDLVRRRIIAGVPESCDTYYYEPGSGRDQLVACVDSTYRRELIRLSKLIHSKPSAAVREFAKAFRLKKDNE